MNIKIERVKDTCQTCLFVKDVKNQSINAHADAHIATKLFCATVALEQRQRADNLNSNVYSVA